MSFLQAFLGRESFRPVGAAPRFDWPENITQRKNGAAPWRLIVIVPLFVVVPAVVEPPVEVVFTVSTNGKLTWAVL